MMAAGFDGIARVYDQFLSKIESSGATSQQLRQEINASLDNDLAVKTLHDTAVRAGFGRGMPMP